MYVEMKSMRNRDEDMMVFKFENEEDRDGFLQGMRDYVSTYVRDSDVSSWILEPIETLSRRIDDRYATKDFMFSGALFRSEISDFITGLALTACCLTVTDRDPETLHAWKGVVAEQDRLIELQRDTIQDMKDMIREMKTLYHARVGLFPWEEACASENGELSAEQISEKENDGDGEKCEPDGREEGQE